MEVYEALDLSLVGSLCLNNVVRDYICARNISI